MTNYIELCDITKSYGETRVIGPTSLSILRGQFVSILGPSGSGKSTILNMIAGLAFPTTGTVAAKGQEITGPGADRGVVFQDHALLPWMSARANVDFGLKAARPKLDKSQRAEITERFLHAVGLGHAATRRPAQLSGGMQQRVGLARAFAVDSDILLLDEPFGALDALTRRQLQDLLLKVWRDNRRTVVMVTHDVDEAIRLSDRIIVMSCGPEATVISDITNDGSHPGLREELLSLLVPGR